MRISDMWILIFNILYYIVILVAVIVFLVASLAVYLLTVPFDRSRRVVHELSRCISMIFLGAAPGWRTSVEGLENVGDGPWVIVLNHRSMVDIPMLYWVPLNFRWVAKSSLRSMPFIGQYMWLHGDILIPRDNPRKAISMVMNDGRAWLRDRKVSVAVFPEGTRSKSGEVGRFKPTAFTLAKEAGVGVLPVVLDGSDVVGKHGRIPWRHTFTVRVLPPVSADEVAASDPKVLMERVRESMVEAQRQIVARQTKNDEKRR